MATITIQVNTGVGTVTRSRTITGAHLVRFVAVYRAFLNMPQATDDQVLTAWADRVFDGAKQRVLEQEQQAARVSANAGVSEIGLT